MVESMLKELRIKFNMLQCSMINNSVTGDAAIKYFDQIMFATKVLRTSVLKRASSLHATQIEEVNNFFNKLVEFKSKYANLFDAEEIDNSMIEEFKTELPKRIKRRPISALNVDTLGLMKKSLEQFKNQFEDFKKQVLSGSIEETDAVMRIDGYYIMQLEKFSFERQHSTFNDDDLTLFNNLIKDIMSLRKQILSKSNNSISTI